MHRLNEAAGRFHLKKLLLYVASFALLVSSPLHAQEIIGTWQGILPDSDNPRIVLKIAMNEDGSLRAGYLLIDRDTSSVPFSAIAFASPDLNLASDVADVSYAGKLAADGKSITGVWTQKKKPSPLTFVLATADTRWKSGGSGSLPPMSATTDPAFEVATIKPSPPDAKHWSYATRTRQFQAKATTVSDLIQFAWQLRTRQLEGGPPWINDLKFDISAEPDAAGQPSLDQYRLMLQKLLMERFGLKFHKIEKIFPIYTVTIERNLPRLIRTDPDEKGPGSIYVHKEDDGEWRLQFASMTMLEFDNLLMNFIKDRQIVDETGLTGLFGFTLRLPAGALGEGSNVDDNAAAYIHALEAQLGLKLNPKKAPLMVLVVDRLEKPSAN